jgi:hypothetical protein
LSSIFKEILGKMAHNVPAVSKLRMQDQGVLAALIEKCAAFLGLPKCG